MLLVGYLYLLKRLTLILEANTENTDRNPIPAFFEKKKKNINSISNNMFYSKKHTF